MDCTLLDWAVLGCTVLGSTGQCCIGLDYNGLCWTRLGCKGLYLAVMDGTGLYLAALSVQVAGGTEVTGGGDGDIQRRRRKKREKFLCAGKNGSTRGPRGPKNSQNSRLSIWSELLLAEVTIDLESRTMRARGQNTNSIIQQIDRSGQKVPLVRGLLVML